MLVRRRLAGILVVLALGAGACTTYRDQLARGQHAFDQNEHDRALAILRDLEPDTKRLTPAEQASYAYLRGMSDYRIGYRSDARHWLSVAKAHEERSPGVLPADWKARATEALDHLNGLVYAEGAGALTTSRLAAPEDGSLAAAPGPAPKASTEGPKAGARPASDVAKDAPADSTTTSP
ncbi:MAG: hypothetical protein KF850_00170 [Labilithrix sp.]|nr:hypothetical protein [Labilithrix sp.]MBX3210425.1 hypothetical protein [Labilithrix sp.]